MIGNWKSKINDSVRMQAFVAFVLSSILFSIVHQLSITVNHKKHFSETKQLVLQRIALDLPIIPIERAWLNESGDNQEVQAYIQQLNKGISNKEWPIEVTYIGPKKPVNQFQILTSVEQNVYVAFTNQSFNLFHGFSVTPFAFGVIFAWLVVYSRQMKESLKPIEQRISTSPLLITVDLRSKLIINARTKREIALSNKPLCFYCALVEFSIANPGTSLNMNKDLPEEFLVLAQKYFYRLIELGHTIRKRPNFESNLDKTLSEIRAALEDVLAQDIKSKELLIPPKAIGEGSRSKLHSFTLVYIEESLIEIVGK